MLTEHVEQFIAVALPPAPRMAGYQEAGQPGQHGSHHMPNAVAVRWKPMRTICCMVVSCSASISWPVAVIW